jgi:hypothetical protein
MGHAQMQQAHLMESCMEHGPVLDQDRGLANLIDAPIHFGPEPGQRQTILSDGIGTTSVGEDRSLPRKEAIAERVVAVGVSVDH